MKLLVYAFEPWGKYQTNISQEVLKRIKDRPGLTKVVIPVQFNDSELLQAVKHIKPDAILGLGQYPRGRKLRIERKTKNQRKCEPIRKILSQGPRYAFATLKLKPDKIARFSYDAGRYVCNFTAYNLLTNPATKQIPSGFIHIPIKAKLADSIRTVEVFLAQILNC